MRRAVARGRVFPQSYSTDRRYGRLSLKACALFPLMWANADDQGRLPGDPEEIKYAACPNIDHITKADIPELLEDLEKNQLIKAYNTAKTEAIQLLDWWDVHRPQWAWPSQYPPPEGWQDHLRYKKGAKTVVTHNWFSQVSENDVSGEHSGETQQISHVSSKVSENNPSGERSGETHQIFPLTTLSEKESEKERGKRKRRGRGNSPESSGEKPSPSPAGLLTDKIEILQRLTECFKREWGQVPAGRPYEIIPREPTARESAQLRDLARELSAGGGCEFKTIEEAYRDVAGHPGKMHISYLRKVLFAWLDRERSPPA